MYVEYTMLAAIVLKVLYVEYTMLADSTQSMYEYATL